ECPRIVVVKLALASGFVDHGAESTTRGGIRQVECSALHAAVLLPKQRDEVVTKTVIERQRSRHLPTVLKVGRQRMVAQTRIRDCRNRETVRAAHQKTR